MKTVVGFVCWSLVNDLTDLVTARQACDGGRMTVIFVVHHYDLGYKTEWDGRARRRRGTSGLNSLIVQAGMRMLSSWILVLLASLVLIQARPEPEVEEQSRICRLQPLGDGQDDTDQVCHMADLV